MTSRERIRAIIAGESADRCGLWLGEPKGETWPAYLAHLGVETPEAFRQRLGDDFRWICPQFFGSCYQHPDGKGMFDMGLSKTCHGQAGPFAECEDADEIEDAEWPNPDYLNFDECLAALDGAGEVYRASGFWTCFYHNVMDLFGMEAYMMKMHLDPIRFS